MLMGLGLVQQAREVIAKEATDRFEFGIRNLTIDAKVGLDREAIWRPNRRRTTGRRHQRDVRLPFPIRFWPPLEHAGTMNGLSASGVPETLAPGP
jgi:hypothetical protein